MTSGTRKGALAALGGKAGAIEKEAASKFLLSKRVPQLELQATRAGAGEERCLVTVVLGVGLGLEVGKADYFFQKLHGNVVLREVSTTSTANVSGGIGN